MIAKISRGASVKGLANYLHGPGKANEHVYDGREGGQVIGGNMGAEGARDGSVWADDMAAVMGQRVDVERPVWHMSLRLPEGDPTLTDEGWRQIGQSMGEQMGWAEHPWVMVRHGDDHVHIAVSRVGFDGELWHGRNDYREAQKARQNIEREWGLTQTRTMAREGRTGPQLTQGEYAQGVRTGQVPAREELRARVGACVAASKGLGRETFEQVLESQGVAYRANVASTGRVSGYSFALPVEGKQPDEWVWFKASQLDKGLSWSKVSPQLDAPLPEPTITEPPKKLMESRSRHAERVAAARNQARARGLAQRRAQAPQVAQERQASTSGKRFIRWRSRHLSSERTKVPRERAKVRELKKLRKLSFPEPATKAVRRRPPARAAATRKLAPGVARFAVQAAQEQVVGRSRNEGLSR